MKETIDNLVQKFLPQLERLRRYKTLFFFVLLVGIYGFLVFKINVYNTLEPSDDAVTSKLQTTPTPKIDEDIIDKLNQLQDNSSSVKTLFDEARENPFRE